MESKWGQNAQVNNSIHLVGVLKFGTYKETGSKYISHVLVLHWLQRPLYFAFKPKCPTHLPKHLETCHQGLNGHNRHIFASMTYMVPLLENLEKLLQLKMTQNLVNMPFCISWWKFFFPFLIIAEQWPNLIMQISLQLFKQSQAHFTVSQGIQTRSAL